jgi:hypothetical protein
MTVDVLDYLGKHEDGIIVSITIGYDGEFYNAHFYYTDTFLALSVYKEMEDKIGCQIEDWENYDELIKLILTKVVSFEEMSSRIDDFNPAEYNLYKADPSELNNKTQQ